MSTSREPEGHRRPPADESPLAGARHRARERALALLYEAETKSADIGDVLESLPLAPEPYAADLVLGVARRGAEVDSLIAGAASGWRIERMPVVDRQLLRIAVFELLERDDVPVAVVLDEAVELAKAYSTDGSGRFVNGVLATLAPRLRVAGARPR